jgi:lysophospholipase L1-like esterase
MRDDPYFPQRHGYNSLIESLDKNAPLDLVVLQMGCNELKQVYNLTAGMIAFGFERLVAAAKQPFYGYPVPEVLVIAPSPVGEDMECGELGFVFGPEAYPKSLQLGELYEDIAKRNGCGFIDCGKLDFSLNDIDYLHYSRDDHKKLADAVAPKIKSMLG